MSRRVTLRELIDMHPEGFRIAYYQRHYLWGQSRDGSDDSVACLTKCLLDAFSRGDSYFLQGITVSAAHLVDGQQRITYLLLLTRTLGYQGPFSIKYDNRPEAERWLSDIQGQDINEDEDEESQDIYYFKLTLRIITQAIEGASVDKAKLLNYLLDNVHVLYIKLPEYTNEVAIYKMMNGTKAQMDITDIIKADMMRKASDPSQPQATDWLLASLRIRYANEWESWTRWWNRYDVSQYYSPLGENGLQLLIKLCMREATSDFTQPLTYHEFDRYISITDEHAYHAAKHFFVKLRRAQLRFEASYNDPTSYNRLRAILLLQPKRDMYKFLYMYIISAEISDDELERYYKLSFLGMSIDAIYSHESASEYFDDMLASLSMPDVYHSDTKRDVFNLLLRLNIDEDSKLGRKFDFRVWSNRSLEHIYSKSKVWHIDETGKICDGNDNPLSVKPSDIEKDATFMRRSKIVNHDGTQLSEHCIGNLVLLYGENNASFGNATFEQKKLMFLAPGDRTVFQSRNLLHTVCVFAGRSWDHTSIVNNYNQTLKNLKIYYGYK